MTYRRNNKPTPPKQSDERPTKKVVCDDTWEFFYETPVAFPDDEDRELN